MSGIVLTFPILPGKEEGWRYFCQELSGSQLQMYLSSRRSMGITHERLVLVKNAFGSSSVTTLEAPNIAQAIRKLINSRLPFDVWYRERIQELHGIDMAGYEQYSQPMPMPLNHDVYFDWRLNSSNPKKGLTFFVRSCAL
jgi:hypothetical protein